MSRFRRLGVNESAARQVLLIRAIEGADAGGVLTEEDRVRAARAATEWLRWQGGSERSDSAEAFVIKRAELLADTLAERAPVARRWLSALRWRPWIGVVVPILVLLVGVLAEHLSGHRHLNVLAFPLLGLIVWNLLVYAGLLISTVRARLRSDDVATRIGWTQQIFAGAQRFMARRSGGALTAGLLAFSADWSQRSRHLQWARIGRVLHLSAAMLAIGAVSGLYLRGVMFEYRAGWESTFLDADGVHRVLGIFLQPIVTLIGQQLPTVQELELLRWDRGNGENAARWIHWYTLAVGLTVIVPRLLLTLVSAWRAHVLAARFPMALDDAYFRRVLNAWRSVPTQVGVIAYAWTPGDAGIEGLQRLLQSGFGVDARVLKVRHLALGDEDAPGILAAEPAPDIVVLLCNLATIPEAEHHGVLIDAFKSQAVSGVLMIVDESAYRLRLGAQAGAAQRLDERRQVWAGFAASRTLPCLCVDLGDTDFSAIEPRLDALRLNLKAAH